MSSPRDRDGDGFDDGRPAGPSGWQEPAHLGGADPTPGAEGPAGTGGSPPAEPGTGGESGSAGSTAAGGWQPPGWDLPAVEPERPAPPASGPTSPAPGPEHPGGWATPSGAPGPEAAWQPPVTEQRQSDVPPAQAPRRGWGGLFGPRQPPAPQPDAQQPGAQQPGDEQPWPEQPGDRPPADQLPPERLEQRGDWNGIRPQHDAIAAPSSDAFATQAWAQQVGWVLSDGTAPEDEALLPLLQSAPVRPGKEDRPSRVLRGRGNGLDLVAFDIASPAGRSWLSTHAVTAAPVLGSVPGFRLSPARMWRHGTGGLLQIPSPDQEFDRRWVLLAAEDGPQVRRLVEDPLVRQSLLGSDDGDELWSAAGFVAAIRPDANRPQLIEHHARLLAAVVGALAATW